MARIRMSYRAYIESEIWERRRAEYYTKYGRQCWACGTQDAVQLHHMTYANMGREEDGDLAPLCRTHHDLVHAYRRAHPTMPLAVATTIVVSRVRDRETSNAQVTVRRNTRQGETARIKEHNRLVREVKRARAAAAAEEQP